MRLPARGVAAAIVAAVVVSVTTVLTASSVGASPTTGPDPIASLAGVWRDARGASVLTAVAATVTTATAERSETGARSARLAGPVVASASRASARHARAVADAAHLDAAAAGETEARSRAAVIAAISERTGAPVEALTAEWTATPGPALDVLAAGLIELGKPYRYGGAGPDSYDCSGFVAAAYAAIGFALPHQSAAQWGMATPVPAARPGDVLVASGLGHIGLAVGAGVLLHAPQTGDVVKLSPVPAAYRAGRLLPE